MGIFNDLMFLHADRPTEEEIDWAAKVRDSDRRVSWEETLQGRFVGIPHPAEAFPNTYPLAVKVFPYQLYAKSEDEGWGWELVKEQNEAHLRYVMEMLAKIVWV